MRGVLSGLEAAADLDFRECEYFVGTSAGSIVAATLAAGRRPEAGDRAARDVGRGGARAGGERGLPAARRAPPAGAGAPPRARSRRWRWPASRPRGARCAPPRSPPSPRRERTLERLGEHIDALGARFDGRLRIAAVDRRSGRRVMFGAPGAPDAEGRRGACWPPAPIPWRVRAGGDRRPRVRRRRRLEPDQPRRGARRPRRARCCAWSRPRPPAARRRCARSRRAALAAETLALRCARRARAHDRARRRLRRARWAPT